MSGRRNTPPGPGADASGQTAVDPTENVKALQEASNKRSDDLRLESEKFTNARIDNLQREIEIRAECAKELVSAESRRVDEQATLRATYSEKLSDAEAKRIDAIRAVDVAAVSVASQRASDQAQVLATQVTASAEALRVLVATTATTVATSLQQMSTTLSTRLTTLEQASYQSAGKQSYADPAFVELLSEVKQLREANRQGAGKTEGIGSIGSIVAVGVSLLIALGSLMYTVLKPAQPGYSSAVPVVPVPAVPKGG